MKLHRVWDRGSGGRRSLGDPRR